MNQATFHDLGVQAKALWAKTSREHSDQWHPLWCHLVDVMAVAQELAEHTLPPSALQVVAQGLGVELASVPRWLAFFASVHDIGKASVSFQMKWPLGEKRAREAGFPFSNRADTSLSHGLASTVILTEWLSQSANLDHSKDRAACQHFRTLARVLGGHHGRLQTDRAVGDAEGKRRHLGREAEWVAAREQILALLLGVLGLDLKQLKPPAQRPHAAFAIIGGHTVISDWLGSDEVIFACSPDANETYLEVSRARAKEVLHRAGFRPLAQRETAGFDALFPGFVARPLQAKTEALAKSAQGPVFAIVEAPMGAGKTEAALYAAHALAGSPGNRGLYIGLPTQATGNQMFKRVTEFLSQTYPLDASHLVLAHGNAMLNPDFEAVRVGKVYDEETDAGVFAAQWFVRSKRSLLSPYGVGTVDQALLGVMSVKHSLVRLFALAGKVVVLDEVHAYDTYTSTLIERLISWLQAMGTSVLLLSATLPAARRRALVKAWGQELPIVEAPYPRITWVANGAVESVGFENDGAQLEVELVRLADDGTVVGELLARIESGGCAVYIANTVGRAQEAYRRAAAQNDALPEAQRAELLLLHSRMTLEQRERVEAQAAKAFGKKGKRPQRALLIGTQVLEQSLDFDFDVMASDMAPLDLVLQRVGRLHRHERPIRPEGVRQPRLLLVGAPAQAVVLPDFNEVAIVYETSVVARSWARLEGKTALNLPEELEALVEDAYTLEPVCAARWLAELKQLDEKTQQKAQEDELNAKGRLLKTPDKPDDIFGEFEVMLEEEDESVHKSLRAMTRLGERTIRLICLTRDAEGQPVVRGKGVDIRVDLDKAPSPQLQAALLGQSIRVASRKAGLVFSLLEQPSPPGWEKCGALRDARPVVFDGGKAVVGDARLELHPILGLLIQSDDE